MRKAFSLNSKIVFTPSPLYNNTFTDNGDSTFLNVFFTFSKKGGKILKRFETTITQIDALYTSFYSFKDKMYEKSNFSVASFLCIPALTEILDF